MIRENDMIVATQGRAFWVLDDLNPLYELDKAKSADFYVYQPENAIRDNAFRTGNASIGQNPYPGFSIMYYIRDNKDTVDLQVEFSDAEGNVVRTFASNADKNQEKLRKKSGMNRLNWNLSVLNPEGVEGVFMGLGAGGHRVAPGKYTMVMTYGGEVVKKELVVEPDPRWEATPAQYGEQQRLLNSLREKIDKLQEVATNIRSVRAQVNDLKERIDSEEFADVHELANALIEDIDAMEEKLIQPNQKTFQDVINFPNKVEAQLLHIYGTIDGIEPPVTDGQKKRAIDVMKEADVAMSEGAGINEKLNELMQLIRDRRVPFIAPKKKK